MSATDLRDMFNEQMKSLQRAFADALAKQEAQHQETIGSLRKEIEEIRYNPLSAILTPPPVPTGVDL